MAGRVSRALRPLTAGRLEVDQEIAKRVDELCRIAIEEKGARCLSKFPLQLVRGRGFLASRLELRTNRRGGQISCCELI
jgi:hypothetical protein